MSRLTVLQTIHDKFFKKWISHYYEDYYYSNILYQDINIRIFFNGLFYRLKLPTNYFIFKRLSYKLFIIYGDIMFLSKKSICIQTLQYKEQLNLTLFFIKHTYFIISYFISTIFNYSYQKKKKSLLFFKKRQKNNNNLKYYLKKKRYKLFNKYKKLRNIKKYNNLIHKNRQLKRFLNNVSIKLRKLNKKYR